MSGDTLSSGRRRWLSTSMTDPRIFQYGFSVLYLVDLGLRYAFGARWPWASWPIASLLIVAALLAALADPDARTRLPYGAVSGYSGAGDATLKQRLFYAGLAGLGRLSPEDIERGAEALDVRIGAENAWTRAIDRAADAREPGTVLVLAAAGMQTSSWSGVPAEALYHIVRAMRVCGKRSQCACKV